MIQGTPRTDLDCLYAMEIQVRLVIHQRKSIYDDLTVTSSSVVSYRTSRPDEICQNGIVCAPGYLNRRQIDAYAISAYVDTLKRSSYYRRCALKLLLHWVQRLNDGGRYFIILIRLRTPRKQFLDYKWGRIISTMAYERSEVDHAMSWLSTLGGAYSALGEHFEYCAQMAGKISLHQFKLALKLGDPLLVARCKLYAALSMIQRGNLKIPKRMIREIFVYAGVQKDEHLRRMCKGVWSKLSYYHKIRREHRIKERNEST